jgi:hypothetical protein
MATVSSQKTRYSEKDTPRKALGSKHIGTGHFYELTISSDNYRLMFLTNLKAYLATWTLRDAGLEMNHYNDVTSSTERLLWKKPQGTLWQDRPYKRKSDLLKWRPHVSVARVQLNITRGNTGTRGHGCTRSEDSEAPALDPCHCTSRSETTYLIDTVDQVIFRIDTTNL